MGRVEKYSVKSRYGQAHEGVMPAPNEQKAAWEGIFESLKGLKQEKVEPQRQIQMPLGILACSWIARSISTGGSGVASARTVSAGLPEIT